MLLCFSLSSLISLVRRHCTNTRDYSIIVIYNRGFIERLISRTFMLVLGWVVELLEQYLSLGLTRRWDACWVTEQDGQEARGLSGYGVLVCFYGLTE
jgi:hypothetical protein